MHSEFEKKKTDVFAVDSIRIFRQKREIINWKEDVLKTILQPKGIWENVLSVDNKKLKGILNAHLIKENEIENAKEVEIKYAIVSKLLP